MRRCRVAVAAVLALAVLAGCQRGDPIGVVTPLVPPSSQSGSGSATPSVTPTPSKEALLAEAERRYREFFVLENQLEAAGGAEQLNPEMSSYLDNPYKDLVAKYYAEMKSSGMYVENADRAVVTSIVPIDETPVEGAVVAIRTCEDTTKTTLVAGGGVTSAGLFIKSDLWFKRAPSGALVIFYGVTEGVSTC